MWKLGKPVLEFSSSPVFSEADRVASGGGGGDQLPAELVGKSAAEIATYYRNRETALRAELDARPPAHVTPPAEPAGPTNAEFFNDPAASAERIVNAKALTKAEWDRVAASQRPNMIWVAKRQIMERHPDWNRLEREITEIMKMVPDYQQTDPSMWETVYVQAKGMAHDRLAAEDRANPPVIIGEPGNPGGTAPPVDADLYKVTAPGVSKGDTVKSAGKVADNLGITHDSYRKSTKILNEGDGLLPLTYDNRRSK